MEAFGLFYETILARSYDDTYLCKICVGPRANHHVLDNHSNQGVRIILADQHASPLITDSSEWCTVILRYSNMSFEDQIEYLWLPMIKEGYSTFR